MRTFSILVQNFWIHQGGPHLEGQPAGPLETFEGVESAALFRFWERVEMSIAARLLFFFPCFDAFFFALMR